MRLDNRRARTLQLNSILLTVRWWLQGKKRRKGGGNKMDGSKEERRRGVWGYIVLHIEGIHFSRRIVRNITHISENYFKHLKIYLHFLSRRFSKPLITFFFFFSILFLSLIHTGLYPQHDVTIIVKLLLFCHGRQRVATCAIMPRI